MSRDQNKKERRKLFTLNKDTYTTTCTVSHRKVLQPFAKATDFIDSTLSCADPSWLHLWVAVFQQEIRNWIQKQTRKKKIEKDAISKNLSQKKKQKKTKPTNQTDGFPIKTSDPLILQGRCREGQKYIQLCQALRRCPQPRFQDSKSRQEFHQNVQLAIAHIHNQVTCQTHKGWQVITEVEC